MNMKFKDMIEETFGRKNSKKIADKFMALSVIGSMINLFREGIDELDEPDVTEQYEKLSEIIMKKREQIWETDLESKKGGRG